MLCAKLSNILIKKMPQINKKLPRLVITGSEGFLGRHLCRHLADRFEVLKLDRVLGHDLTDENFVQGWFKENKNLYGMIVGHAYTAVVPPISKQSQKNEPHHLSLKELRNYFEVNSISAFDICRHFIKNNKKGVIASISSIYGAVAPHHEIYGNFVKPIGYSMSKAALQIMTKYLATYYGPQFRFNTVILGGIPTGKQNSQFLAGYSRHTPLRRPMKIEEVLPVFDFIFDKKSSYLTGADIFVDGGWTAW